MILAGIGQVTSAMRTMMFTTPGPTNAAASSSRIHSGKLMITSTTRMTAKSKRAVVAGNRADDDTDRGREEGRDEPDDQRDPSAEQRPREHIPAQCVRAEPVRPRSVAGWLGQVQGVCRLLSGTMIAPMHQDGDHDDARHRQAVATEPVQRPPERGLFAGGSRPATAVARWPSPGELST